LFPDRKSDAFVGKVRSNFKGSEFTGYGGGENPSKKSKSKDSADRREEHVHIVYENGSVATRYVLKDVRIVIPQLVKNGSTLDRVRCQPTDPDTQGLAAIDRRLPMFDRPNLDEREGKGRDLFNQSK